MDNSNRLIFDLTEADYQKIDALRSSDLKTLYDDALPRLEQKPPQDLTPRNNALRFGTMAHLALLEPVRARRDLRVMPEVDLRTKFGRETRNSHAEKWGREWLYIEEAQSVFQMGQVLRDNDNNTRTLLELEHQTEVTAIAYDPEFDCHRKARLDFVCIDQKIWMDYKTTRNCHPRPFGYDINKNHYDLSCAFHLDTLCLITGDDPNDWIKYWLAQEKESPYLYNLFRVDQFSYEIGREKYRQAMANMLDQKEFGTRIYSGNEIQPDYPKYYGQ